MPLLLQLIEMLVAIVALRGNKSNSCAYLNLKLERHNNMLIEINGKVTELTRVTGINTKLESVKASDIDSSSILMKVPYKYVP